MVRWGRGRKKDWGGGLRGDILPLSHTPGCSAEGRSSPSLGFLIFPHPASSFPAAGAAPRWFMRGEEFFLSALESHSNCFKCQSFTQWSIKLFLIKLLINGNQCHFKHSSGAKDTGTSCRVKNECRECQRLGAGGMNSPPEPQKASNPAPGMRPPAPVSPAFLAWGSSDQRAGPRPSASEMGGGPPCCKPARLPLPPLRAVPLTGEQSCLRPQVAPTALCLGNSWENKVPSVDGDGGITLSVPHPQPRSWCTYLSLLMIIVIYYQ